MTGVNPWLLTHDADPLACAIADRHYSRKKPGSKSCAPPGRKVVLRVGTDQALWITSWPLPEYVQHRWPGPWLCSAFRRESHCPYRASDLIRRAVATTRWYAAQRPSWQRMPVCPLGVLTFVDESKVEAKELPGYAFLRAGFRYLRDATGQRARTKDRNLLVLWLPRSRWPEPIRPAQWEAFQ